MKNPFEIKRKLNKWQFVLDVFDDYRYYDGRKRVLFGIIKLISYVKSGDSFGKQHYKGFFFDKTIKLWD